MLAGLSKLKFPRVGPLRFLEVLGKRPLPPVTGPVNRELLIDRFQVPDAGALLW
jgi:hypothetical protein